jgi:hypothetical protein
VRHRTGPALLEAAGLPPSAKVSEGPVLVDNVALAACNATRDEDDPTKVQVFARVLNFRNDFVSTRVQLNLLVNGQLRSVYEQKLEPDREKNRDLRLPPRTVKAVKVNEPDEYRLQTVPTERSVTFDLADLDDTANVVVHLRLLSVGDQLPLDDEAWVVVSAVRKARVLIVGRANDVLQKFFDQPATRDVADVTYLSPSDLAKDSYRKPAHEGAYDLILFDRCGPEKEEDMPRSNTFFIAYPPPPWKPDAVERFNNPQIRGWEGKHPLMRYLAALHDVGIDDAFRAKDLPPRTPRLMESDKDTALLFTLSRQSFTDLVMTFPIITDKDEYNTNWWKLPSFPLFLRNVLYVLGNVSDETGEETVRPGQVKTLRPDVPVSQVEVTDPEGKVQNLSRGTRADFAYGGTERVGIYRVGWDGKWQRSFAVNLLDPDESNIEPRTDLRFGAERVAAGEGRNQPRELWKWLLLVALGLLLAEWYIYNRRIYV